LFNKEKKLVTKTTKLCFIAIILASYSLLTLTEQSAPTQEIKNLCKKTLITAGKEATGFAMKCAIDYPIVFVLGGATIVCAGTYFLAKKVLKTIYKIVGSAALIGTGAVLILLAGNYLDRKTKIPH